MNQTLRIFVSHSSTYVELAKSLKLSLQALESGPAHLDVRISAEMAGATDWREWIEENVRGAEVFLFLYPHVRMEMNWCNYELGRFYDVQKKRYVVCLKNLDIPKPPPAFEPYQAYNGDREGLAKFLRELFVEGVFSNQHPLNADVGKIGTDHYKRAIEVASELAEKFAQARVRERLYDRRIEVCAQYEGGALDPDRTTVVGNAEGLAVLGLDTESRISWATLKASLGAGHGWPLELERALPGIARGALPPSLAPFRVAQEVFVPVISRAENVDDALRRVAVIFVAIPSVHLQSLSGWATPPAMPESFAELIRIVRMMLRTRWELLEPQLMAVRYGKCSNEQCAAMAGSILASYEQMGRDAQQQSPMGPDSFRNLFDRTLRPEVDKAGLEFMAAAEALKAAADAGCAEVAKALERLLDNGALWLHLAARQFEIHVGDLTLFSGGTVSKEASADH